MRWQPEWVDSLIKVLVNFATTVKLEIVHPLQGGVLRVKHPSERRPGLPRESAFIFWPRFVWERLSEHAVHSCNDRGLLLLKFVITRDGPLECTTTPGSNSVSDDEETTPDFLTDTTGALAAVTHFSKIARLTGVARVVLKRDL